MKRRPKRYKKSKTLSIGLLAVLIGTFLVLVPAGYVLAISGVCSNCHTMHNSQGGSGEVQTYSNGSITTGVTTPQEYLLKASCIACHAGSTGKTNSFNAPIVVHTTAPSGQGGSYTLAGGDFYWVATGLGATDSKGHNVNGLADEDASIGKTPPGWDPNATPGQLSDGQIADGASSWTTQLSCAGQYGCHGAHTSTGITGAHHGNTGGTATQASSPSTVGASYRFLGGIKGLENSDWNWGETATSHNEYYGVDDTNNRNQSYTSYNDKTTISYSCAQCHGYFHSRIDDTTTGSPWLRHPTDIVLPSTAGKEYSNYNPDNSNLYSLEAPVARPAVPSSSSSTVTVGDATNATGAIVMCLSCHRAHGSSEPDILRWTYSGIQAGSGTTDSGCFICHTTKNAD